MTTDSSDTDAGPLPIRVPYDESHRTCSECGQDCLREPTVLEGLGVRVAFVCAAHVAHTNRRTIQGSPMRIGQLFLDQCDQRCPVI